jgi:hypothetical protein
MGTGMGYSCARRRLAAVLCCALLWPVALQGVAAAEPSDDEATPATQEPAETGPPTDLGAVSTLGRVHLWWGWPSPLPEREVTGWLVERRAPGGAWAPLATAEVEAHVDATVTPGRPYEYRVRATGPDGDGAVSAPLAVTATRRDLAGSASGRLVTTPSVALGADVRELWLSNVARPAVSPDGRWTVVSTLETTETTHLWRVPTIGPGSPLQLTSLPGSVEDPAWSPDGARIAFTHRVEGAPPSVWQLPAGGGAATRIVDRAEEPEWDRDGTLIVTDLSTATPRLARISATGARGAIAGTSGGRSAAVSPDGRYLAFTVPGTSTGPWGDAVRDRAVALLPLDGAGSSARLTTLTDGGYGRPTWHPDGRSVATSYGQRTWSGSRATDTYGIASLRLVTSGGARLEAHQQEPSRFRRPAYRTLGVHLTSAPTLTGAAPRIGFAVRSPVDGTTFTCRLDGAPAAPCTSPWRGSGLTTGAHHLVVEAREPSGARTVTSHRWQVDATVPTVALSAPSAVTLADRATVTYRANDANGIRDHDVRYRRARSDGTFGAWQRPSSWQATTATSRSIDVPRGYEYCFSVRARDTVGNVSAWSPPRCTSRPLDDRSLSASSAWTRGTGSAYVDGTVTSTTRQGAEVTRREISARRVYLVATRCPTCGTADVFIGSTRVGRVDLHATTTQHQRVIALPASSSVRSGKLTVRVTSSGKRVAIDGVAFRRS